MSDIINHPKHYIAVKPEPIELVEAWGFETDYYIATAIKYIGRFRFKGNPIDDLKKAVWFLNRKIERLEKEEKAARDIAIALDVDRYTTRLFYEDRLKKEKELDERVE